MSDANQLDFGERLSLLCSDELAGAHGDAERIGAMVERLTHSLAFTIAMATRGDAKGAQTFLTGVESYLYETSAKLAPLGALMARRGL